MTVDYVTEVPPAEVWVRSDTPGVTHRLISTAPLVAAEGGHYWMFDGFASDMEDPYSCLLCTQAKWKVYRELCPAADLLAVANADRDRWIAENRVEGVPEGADFESGKAGLPGAKPASIHRRMVSAR